MTSFSVYDAFYWPTSPFGHYATTEKPQKLCIPIQKMVVALNSYIIYDVQRPLAANSATVQKQKTLYNFSAAQDIESTVLNANRNVR
jgi:hypothetical protein